MEMVNGYVFLDLTKANVYQKALKVLTTDKPVVVSDGSGAPYFVDSMVVDGTNIVITKGGKTITIANDNTITNVGDIQNHLYLLNFKLSDSECSFIVDKKFEDYTIENCDGLTDNDKNYLKSLDGHFISRTSLVGYEGSSSNIVYGYINELKNLFLNLDSYIEFSLTNPVNWGEEETLNITCKQLF